MHRGYALSHRVPCTVSHWVPCTGAMGSPGPGNLRVHIRSADRHGQIDVSQLVRKRIAEGQSLMGDHEGRALENDPAQATIRTKTR